MRRRKTPQVDHQIKKTPSLVSFLEIMAHTGTPVGSKLLEEAIEKYPEYYAETVEQRRKLALVPAEVHTDYSKDMGVLFDTLRISQPQATTKA
jgi:hypothetical protein